MQTRKSSAATLLDGTYIPEALPETMNGRQQQRCYDLGKTNFEAGGDGAPLLMMVSGTVGTGK